MERIQLLKQEAPKRYTLGAVYEPDTVDLQGDMASAAEIEASAWNFMRRLAKGEAAAGDMHTDWDPGLGTVVESYLMPVSTTINGELVKKGTWMLGVVWSPDMWAKITAGERTGYSMGGQAQRRNA